MVGAGLEFLNAGHCLKVDHAYPRGSADHIASAMKDGIVIPNIRYSKTLANTVAQSEQIVAYSVD